MTFEPRSHARMAGERRPPLNAQRPYQRFMRQERPFDADSGGQSKTDKEGRLAASRVVLLVGTRKGLFLASAGTDRCRWQLAGPRLPGYEIYHAVSDRRDPALAYAAARHMVWGVHIHRSRDAGQTWEILPNVPRLEGPPPSSDLKAVWYLAPGHSDDAGALFAGVEPAALFVSHDSGLEWEPVASLNHHPTRSTWQPAKGGLALHSIYVDPRERRRIYAAVSAGGVYRSEDGGRNWKPINRGVRADYLAERRPESGHCIHRIVMHPTRPDRLYQQSHSGTYRSDDGGDEWIEITDGLPSDFGYAVATPLLDPDTVYVIPQESSHLRTTVGGALRVYRSRNAGGDWQPLTRGLPQENAYVTVLREAIDTDELDPAGVYFGTSSGHLFASRDGGDSWEMIAGFLPRILSVKAAVIRG
jgi:photosystem II stability/assembly factor-like uncharacterized protein